MADLSTEYLGLKLKSPLVVSSSPLTDSVESIQRLEAAGAAAVVLPSIFEEQLTLESNALDADLQRGTESFSEATSFFPAYDTFRQGQDSYLELVRKAKKAASIPVLASLNGASIGGWVNFAKEIEQAGADALELNTFSLPTDARIPSATIEDNLIELVRQVKASTKIPIAVKLSPQFTSIPNLVSLLEDAGAKGVVLFNRFYQPDFDIETLEVRPTLHFSTPSELLPRLHWAAILYGNMKADLAISGGVHSAEDVLKGIMAGAGITMMASALHIHGIEHIKRVLADVHYWLEKREYTSLWETRGSLSRRSVPDTSPFDRGNYIKTLSSYSLRQTTGAF